MTSTVAYIVGSMSADSLNRRLMGAIIAAAPEGIEFVEVPITDLPVYNPDNDGDFLPLARRGKEIIEQADALVVVTPEYNRSMSGVLKNAIDWFSRPWGEKSFSGKKVCVASAAISPQEGKTARAHLKDCLRVVEAEPVDEAEIGLFVGKDAFTEDGHLVDDDKRARVEEAVKAFVAAFSH